MHSIYIHFLEEREATTHPISIWLPIADPTLKLIQFITGSLGNHENVISFPLMTFCDQQYVEFPKIFNEVCDLNIPLGKDPFSEDYYHSFEKHFGFNDTGHPINIGN